MQDTSGIQPRPNMSASVFDLHQVGRAGQTHQHLHSGYNPVIPNVIQDFLRPNWI